MEVYIDIYLLENIIINLFLLLLTFRLLRVNYKKRNVYLFMTPSLCCTALMAQHCKAIIL